MTRAREAARLIGNNTFRLDSNNAVGFNSTTPDSMFDINRGLTVAGVSTFTGNVIMSGDLTVQGTTTTLDTIVQEVDLINIQANSSTPAIGVTQSGAGAIAAFYDGAVGVATITSGGNIKLPDSSSSSVGRILIGGDTDLQIYHTGSHSFIDDSGTGHLYIRSSSTRIQKFTGENCAIFNADGAVELYYDNSKKIETTGGGAIVTGITTCDGLSLGDSEYAYFGATNDLQIYHDGTNSYIDNNTNSIFIRSNVDGDDNGNIYIQAKSGENSILCNDDGAVQIYYDNAQKLATNATGITITGNVLPEADGTRDLGATGTRWANIYTSDLDLSNESKGGNDVDGSWGSYTIQEGENDLFLINRRNGKTYKFMLQEVS